MAKLTESSAWNVLAAHPAQLSTVYMRELFALAKPQDGVGWRDNMFASEKINGTEGRAVGNGDGTTVYRTRTLRRSGLWSTGEEGPPSLDATAGNLRLQS